MKVPEESHPGSRGGNPQTEHNRRMREFRRAHDGDTGKCQAGGLRQKYVRGCRWLRSRLGGLREKKVAQNTPRLAGCVPVMAVAPSPREEGGNYCPLTREDWCLLILLWPMAQRRFHRN